jgi:hypothetical protein
MLPSALPTELLSHQRYITEDDQIFLSLVGELVRTTELLRRLTRLCGHDVSMVEGPGFAPGLAFYQKEANLLL